MRGREVVCGRGGGLVHVWPGPRCYRAFVGGVQAREAVRRAEGKGGVDDNVQVGRQAAVDGYKVCYVRVGRRAEFNGDKVWLAWSDHISGMGFVEGCGGRG